jgi:hypothetical protein
MRTKHTRLLSRRAALTGLALTSAATLIRPRLAAAATDTPSYNALFGNPPALGRVETWDFLYRSILRDATDPDSRVRYAERREVLPIYGAVHAPAPHFYVGYNDVWFHVGEGYIHSSNVVPVHELFNTPEADVGAGFWGEISVPMTVLHTRPGGRTHRTLFYGSVFRVGERADDATGRAWYRLLDDGLSRAWWVDATHVRRILPDELAPLSAGVPPDAKRVVVSIPEQRLTCFEDSVPVFTTLIATGSPYTNPQGQTFGFMTPPGEHRVEYKRPSRHMAGGDPTSVTNKYDLPGVPWCTYFTRTGLAIHGTTWHNDFGAPASHGCINVPMDAAKWLYRWVTPTATYDDPAHWTAAGEAATRVIVEG